MNVWCHAVTLYDVKPFWEANTGSASQKFPASYRKHMFVTVFTRQFTGFYTSHVTPLDTCYFLRVHFNVTFVPAPRQVFQLTYSYYILWKATGQEDINLEIRKRKFRWTGHTLRKENGEIPKAALHWYPQGNRRGRPKNRWRRSVVKEAGRSWNELRFVAADRQKWKRLIDNLCS